MDSTIEMQQQQQNFKNTKLAEYITQLKPQEKKVLKIAQEHLVTSFSLEKSIGFLNWLKTQN